MVKKQKPFGGDTEGLFMLKCIFVEREILLTQVRQNRITAAPGDRGRTATTTCSKQECVRNHGTNIPASVAQMQTYRC